jgi:hypothetical protein
VTLGLFAKHVVIPICDGDDGDREFRRLLDDLQQEFQPIGTFEEWLVVKIAESMWRLRRANRAERGCVRTTAMWDDRSQENDRILDIYSQQIGELNEAEEQIRTTGTISQRVYAKILPQLEADRQYSVQVEEGSTPADAKIDNEFLSCVKKRRDFLESVVDAGARIADDRDSDHLAYHSLPRADVMDKVLRYEGRVQKQLDWALQKLLECQQRRKVDLSAPVDGYPSARNNAKRTQ